MKKLLAAGLVLFLCISLCVPALAAPDGNAGVLPVTPVFSFSSGAGAWFSECTVHTDGTFEGNYHDSDMGVTGEGYPNGTVYVSTFYGAFDHITQVDAYTWSMKLASLTTEDTPGREWIEDGIKYVASTAVGMPDIGGEVLLYLPGHDRASLPESFLWWNMYSGSGDTDTPQIDYYGLYNVEEELGFGSSLADSQTAQAMQACIDAGEPQRLMEQAAYYGDISVCRMPADQARAFAQVIEDQTAELYQFQEEYGYGPGGIASYAALFDLGSGVPALFFAGGSASWENVQDDGYFWGDVGSFGIWLYENGEAVEYEPPHSGLTLALFPSALFAGGYQGSDGRIYDGRVYPIRAGEIAGDPELILQADYEEGTYSLNGSGVSEAEFAAARAEWDESLALAGHSYGGGVEGYIWGMCETYRMLTVLDAYAGAANAAGMPEPSQLPEAAGVPEQSDAPDAPAPEKVETPEKDGAEDRAPEKGTSAAPVVGVAAVAAAAAVAGVALTRKKKTAKTARAGSVPPAADGRPNTVSVQPQAPGVDQTGRDAPVPAPRRELNFCPQCGSKIQPGDRFCANCGNPLN